MIRILQTPLTIASLKPFIGFSTTKQQTYIPVRPLKDQRNLLFSTGAPQKIPLLNKMFIFTPFLATFLDGYINEWTGWGIAGTIFFFIAGSTYLEHANFIKSHQIVELKINRDISRFYISLVKNSYSQRYQEILLEHQERTFEQMFIQNLHKKTLEFPQNIYNQLSQASETELKKYIPVLKSARDGVILELNRNDIDKIELTTEREVKKAVRLSIRGQLKSKEQPKILEDYTALKEKKNFVLITTKPFSKWNNRPLYFFLNLQVNIEKKYEEYIKALAEGKKIVEP